MKRVIIGLIVCAALIACDKTEPEPTTTTTTPPPSGPSNAYGDNLDCQNDQSKRRGAMCKDGSTSTATGQGACSSHGGVDWWLCK